MRFKSQMTTRFSGRNELGSSPLGALFWIVFTILWSKIIEHQVIGRMYCDELPLKMGGKFCDFKAVGSDFALEFITICFALSR